jgi:hypothetical protein
MTTDCHAHQHEQVGSRWHRYALTQRDHRVNANLSLVNGVGHLYIGSSLRTHINMSRWGVLIATDCL